MRSLILLLLLAACGAQPTPRMLAAERFEVTRDGRQYVVFKQEETFEVIRLGYAKPGEHAKIRATMLAPIPAVTGCKLNESFIQGDSGEMRGKLNCPTARG